VPAGPDLGNFIRSHRQIEPGHARLDKVLPCADHWQVKNCLRDEDPATGNVATFPVLWCRKAVGLESRR
jgi:hypothetical protein